MTERTTPTLLIRRADVDGRRVDVRCAGGFVASVEPVRTSPVAGADVVVDACGGALLPGLHDHHVHLLAMAAARDSLLLGPPAVSSPAAFDAAVRAAGGTGWLRGVGYHETIAGPLDRWRLDALAPGRPVRVQHRTGQLWVLNTAALDATRIDGLDDTGVERDPSGVPTGRLFRLDDVLRARASGSPPDIAAVAADLAGFGITAVSDLTASTDPAELALLAAAAGQSGFPLDVAVTGGPALAATQVGLPRGPVKVILDEARLPPLDDVVAWFRQARAAGRAVAVHCVTRAELVLALAAWDEVGTIRGDRIEHGAVIPLELVPVIAERGLAVVTQPSFVAERGDQYLTDVETSEQPHLWRCASLLAGGIGVGGSSDAPFGNPDPWRAIAAAGDRTTPSGRVIGPGERLPARRALDLYLTPLADPGGRPRRIESGAPADLCLLDAPLDVVLADPVSARVVVTVRRGIVTAGA